MIEAGRYKVITITTVVENKSKKCHTQSEFDFLLQPDVLVDHLSLMKDP